MRTSILQKQKHRLAHKVAGTKLRPPLSKNACLPKKRLQLYAKSRGSRDFQNRSHGVHWPQIRSGGRGVLS